VPETERNTLNSWYAEWLSVEEPEQTKYTTMLILIPQDNQESKSLFVFVPALRRSLRSSLGARCSPLLGTDYAEDDFKWQGYNGGIGGVQAKALGHQQILALVGDFAAMGGNLPDSYYMPLGWPKPSWGAWQLRDVDAINVMPIRSERRGYCYGKRIIYEDSATHYALWEDIFDTEMKLWKTAFLAQRTIVSKSLGEVPGPFVSSGWDLKYNHMTNTSTQNRYGEDLLVDSDAPREYQNLIAYTTPAGLAQIMR